MHPNKKKIRDALKSNGISGRKLANHLGIGDLNVYRIIAPRDKRVPSDKLTEKWLTAIDEIKEIEK